MEKLELENKTFYPPDEDGDIQLELFECRCGIEYDWILKEDIPKLIEFLNGCL